MHIILKPTIFGNCSPQKVKQNCEIQKISFCRGTRLQKNLKKLTEYKRWSPSKYELSK